MRAVCILAGRDYKPDDPSPTGYLERHEWAHAQLKAGRKQTMCRKCRRWLFPVEWKDHKCNAED